MSEDKPTLESVKATAESACCHLEEGALSEFETKGSILVSGSESVTIEIEILPPEGGWAKPTAEESEDD